MSLPKYATDFIEEITLIITTGTKVNKTSVENIAKKYGIDDQNLVKEYTELAIVLMARKLAHLPGKTKYERYEEIVNLYKNQVNLSHRTSQSMLLQQYSTPAPIAYLMGLFCGIDQFGKNDQAIEPSAGNGLLTIAGNPQSFSVNDIDQTRFLNLESQKFRRTWTIDATKLPVTRDFKAVLTNPPFGALGDAELVADKYKIKGLEHIMAIKALDCMVDTGKAAIIIGGHLEFKDNLIPAGKNRIFFAYLYKFYNVVDVINIDGSLYKKQGTSFDVRVILIDGRKKVPEGLPPFAKDIDTKPITDFEELYSRFKTTFKESDQKSPTPAPMSDKIKLLKLRAKALLLLDSTPIDGIPEIEITYSEENSYVSEKINSAEKAHSAFLNFYDKNTIQLQEQFCVMFLNKANKILGVNKLSTGSKDGTVVDIGFIVAMAAKTNASSMLIAHNHPSGNLIPSEADRQLTIQLGKALSLITVRLNDHLIITKYGFYSFANENESLKGLFGGKVNNGLYDRDIKPIVIDGLGALGMPYISASQSCNSLDVDTPDSMGVEIKAALVQLIKDVGDVDTYVAKKLDFTHMELCKYLAAEQVDAVALAIYNIEAKGQGVIIADQTGIGKGRQAAAIIRYGIVNGNKPIFVTEKPNLFSDIYRDLEAIGSKDYRPFIVNGKEAKTAVKDANGEVVYEALEKAAQDKIIKSGRLPSTYDYIMLTYSQISGGEFNKAGQWLGATPKQSFLQNMAKDNIMVLDESHNASGASNTGIVLQSVVAETKGVTFLSATFAKRPDNMPLYAMKTAMQEASMSKDDLVAAIEKGGVALQEVLSSQLVSAGQLIRRERSFEGIEVNYITLTEFSKQHKAVYDNITKIMRDIIQFQEEFIAPEVKQLNEIAQASYSSVEARQGTGKIGVDSTPYFSKVFNQINQMLFAIKALPVAERAIMRMKQGKKPVIAFSSTMGSFLESMEDSDGLPVRDGSMINADFSYTLNKALAGVLRYTEKDETGEPEHKSFDISQFSAACQLVYNKIASQIKTLTSGLFLSPIDVIKEAITAAGYKLAEVTGRKLEVQYIPSKSGIKALVKSRKKENTTDAFRRFNNNEIDCLLINQSGATGASAHALATAKVPAKDVKQRVMIVLQAELDINTEVQKRGRINRTGQIMLPIYDYVISDIPAEKRLMMMLQKKLKSLDANTTSNQKNSEALLKSDDFLNKYGNKVVLDYLVENPKLNKQLDDPLGISEASADDGKFTAPENSASKVAGRVAVLSCVDQEIFYTEVLDRYNDYVEELKQSGMYDLEVEIMDLKAKTLSKEIFKAGKGGKTSFGGNTYIEKCEVNILKKPYTSEDVTTMIKKALGGKTFSDIRDEQAKAVEDHYAIKIIEEQNEIETDYADEIKNITNEAKYKKLDNPTDRREYVLGRESELTEARDKKIEKNTEMLNSKCDSLIKFIKYFSIGMWCTYPSDNENVRSSTTYAVSLGVTINYKTKNPFAPSAIKLNLAISSTLKYVTRPLSKNIDLNAIIGATGFYNLSNWITDTDLHRRWNEAIKESSGDRGVQYIVTGNVLQAFGDSKLAGGKMVQFTTLDGNQRKGILLKLGWKYDDNGGSIVPLIPIYKARKAIRAISNGSSITQGPGGITLFKQYDDHYKLAVPKSRSAGGDIYLDKKLLDLVVDNNFNSVSNSMVAIISPDNLFPVLENLQNHHNVSVRLLPWQMDLIKDELEGDVFSDLIPAADLAPTEIVEPEKNPAHEASSIEPVIDPAKAKRLKVLKLKAQALLLLQL